MVKLNRIYTRTGDAGETGLGTGARVPKDDARIAAFGTVDEANAAIGLGRLHADARLDGMLGRIQNDLFDLGADLCVPESANPPESPPLRMTDAQVSWLEEQIDTLNADLAPLRSFVLPGGSAASAYLHLARTIARRAERLMVTLARSETVGGPALRYVNRLSDFLFVAARHANATTGAGDVLWIPGQNR